MTVGHQWQVGQAGISARRAGQGRSTSPGEPAVAAIGAAVASLGPDVRRPLDLYGFVERTTGDYQVLADLLDLAAAWERIEPWPLVAP